VYREKPVLCPADKPLAEYRKWVKQFYCNTPADVLVRDGVIAKIADAGSLDTEGVDECIDAQGKLLTPGFVDVHTHYDGQATWDDELQPSAPHGITTVVMGNCGVGFAPSRPAERQWLIELMEGVEQIPGSALADGITWNWESFPEYLDELASKPRAIDIAAQVPHGALHPYIMGRKDDNDDGNREASAAEIQAMSELTQEAIAAGAMAFSSNRIPMHTSIHGDPVPGTFASYEELSSLLKAANKNGNGMFQVAPAGSMGEDPDAPLREFALYQQLSNDTGCRVLFGLGQITGQDTLWKEMLKKTEQANSEGAKLTPWVASRPVCVMFSIQGFTPFEDCPSYQALKSLTVMERVAEMAKPEVREKILSEQPQDHVLSLLIGMNLTASFPMPDKQLFEPGPEDSVAAIAKFMLQHFVRDRIRGEKIPLETAIHLMSKQPADVYGLNDRGSVEVGKKADLNIIDLQNLDLKMPRLVDDLPSNSERILQDVEGFTAIIVNGEVTYRNGGYTGAKPGRLLRGRQAPATAAA
jgi:N-acyl-D-aspartate/D-glutamate deacylase